MELIWYFIINSCARYSFSKKNMDTQLKRTACIYHIICFFCCFGISLLLNLVLPGSYFITYLILSVIGVKLVKSSIEQYYYQYKYQEEEYEIRHNQEQLENLINKKK